MRLCDYCRGGLAILGYLEIGDYAFCDVGCAERYIDQLKQELEAEQIFRRMAEGLADLSDNMPDEFGD